MAEDKTLFQQLESGDFSVVLDILESKEGTSVETLRRVAEQVVTHIQPLKWQAYDEALGFFVMAALPHREVIAVLGPVFEAQGLRDFSEKVVSTAAANFLSNPEHLSDVLLFVGSRIVQTERTFYEYLVGVLFSALIQHASTQDFVLAVPYFMKIVDFEPEATEAALNERMKTSFLKLAQDIRNKDEDAITTIEFVNTLRFWSGIVDRNPAWSDAFLQICLQALGADKSLKKNPFRLKVIEVMINAGLFLPCIAPLAKILEKSLLEREDEESTFDWDTLLIADKKIARSKVYQESLFDDSMNMITICLRKLAADIAFPEFAAPVARTLSNIAENAAYEKRSTIIAQLNKVIRQNSDWVVKQRRVVAIVEGYDITDKNGSVIAGTAPMSRF